MKIGCSKGGGGGGRREGERVGKSVSTLKAIAKIF